MWSFSVVGLLFEIQSCERFKHKSTAEPESAGKYLTLDNAVHFVNAIIVRCQGFFLLFGKRCGKVIPVLAHQVQEIFDFPIAFGALLSFAVSSRNYPVKSSAR